MGKVPVRTGGKMKVRRQVDELKRELQFKIQQEEFESAAQLRDQIRELEKQIAQE
ncbi:UvrB/uvrC motif protein [compost metagenome]